MIYVRIEGEPVPQGSMAAKTTSGGRVFVYHANSAVLRRWRGLVASQVKAQWGERAPSKDEWGVCLRFITRRNTDLDKLSRAILDALTGILWEDDRQVVMLVAVREKPSSGECQAVEIATAPFDGTERGTLQEWANRELWKIAGGPETRHRAPSSRG